MVLVLGQGPIGLMFTMLLRRHGRTVVATDTMPERRALVASVWAPRSRLGSAGDGRRPQNEGVDRRDAARIW